jgi:hypothetical protein
MKFRNRKKFRYGIPVYTGPFRALVVTEGNVLSFTPLVTDFVKENRTIGHGETLTRNLEACIDFVSIRTSLVRKCSFAMYTKYD